MAQDSTPNQRADGGLDPEALEGKNFQTKLWSDGADAVTTVPGNIAGAFGLGGGDPVRLTVALVDGTFVFRDTVAGINGEQSNDRTLHAEGVDRGQLTQRFTRTLADSLSLDTPGMGDTRRVNWTVENADLGRLRLEPEPALRPWMPDDGPALRSVGDVIAGPVRRRLVGNPDPQASQGVRNYVLWVPAGFVDELGLEAGDPMAMRLSAREGELAVVYDQDVKGDERGASYVTTVMSKQSGPDDHEQFALNFYKSWAQALGFANTPISWTLERNRIVGRRADPDVDEQVGEEMPQADRAGAET